MKYLVFALLLLLLGNIFVLGANTDDAMEPMRKIDGIKKTTMEELCKVLDRLDLHYKIVNNDLLVSTGDYKDIKMKINAIEAFGNSYVEDKNKVDGLFPVAPIKAEKFGELCELLEKWKVAYKKDKSRVLLSKDDINWVTLKLSAINLIKPASYTKISEAIAPYIGDDNALYNAIASRNSARGLILADCDVIEVKLDIYPDSVEEIALIRTLSGKLSEQELKRCNDIFLKFLKNAKGENIKINIRIKKVK